MEDKSVEQKQFVCYETTVFPKNNLLYLKKAFYEQFIHKIEICMNEDYAGELIVKELNEGVIQKKYYSKSLVSEIVKSSKNEKTMNYAFFKDIERGIWRGILLPKLNGSILWDDLYKLQTKMEILRDAPAQPIIYKMRRKYSSLIEWDELQSYYLLGFEIAKKNYSYIKRENHYVIYMCVSALVKEYARVQRRCKICESKLSLNQMVSGECNYSYGDFYGQRDDNFIGIEIKEFISGLSVIEKKVLNILKYEEKWETKYAGTLMGNIIEQTRESLKKKAYEYFGGKVTKEYGYLPRQGG